MRLADRGHLQELTEQECFDLLTTVAVGRLGVELEGMPAIVPVNFVVVDDRVIVRSGPGAKFAAAVEQPVVAFQADDYDADGGQGWSVLIRGKASVIMEPDELLEARKRKLEAWAFPAGEAFHYLQIEARWVSGRRFARSPSFRS